MKGKCIRWEAIVFYIIQAAGWPIWLLLIASVIALALIIERLYYLRRKRILPDGLLDQVIRDYRDGRIDNTVIARVEKSSPLGIVLATGLQHADVYSNWLEIDGEEFYRTFRGGKMSSD